MAEGGPPLGILMPKAAGSACLMGGPALSHSLGGSVVEAESRSDSEGGRGRLEREPESNSSNSWGGGRVRSSCQS